jgi:methylated-DNA-[protein]-cysteine S-methyltransferase
MVGGMRAARTEYAIPGWGTGELWTGAGVVLAHEFAFDPVSDTGPATGRERRQDHPSSSDMMPPAMPEPTARSSCGQVGTKSAPIDRNRRLTPEALVERFTAFFSGEDPRLDDIPVDLSWATPFQHAVALTLRTVPRGEVVSYGELAALAGYPGAARAAGGFCAGNRFMLIVPCHRVVGATGLGGYGSAGLGVKRRLLELEGVRL